MAVTVQAQTQYLVLDERDYIVGFGSGAEGRYGPLVGSRIWDSFPGSEPLCKPYYDAARRSGETVEFVQFYDGQVARIRAVPTGDGRLELTWELLAGLDTLTLQSLAQTLDEALDALGQNGLANEREAVRRALRLVEGGG